MVSFLRLTESRAFPVVAFCRLFSKENDTQVKSIYYHVPSMPYDDSQTLSFLIILNFARYLG